MMCWRGLTAVERRWCAYDDAGSTMIDRQLSIIHPHRTWMWDYNPFALCSHFTNNISSHGFTFYLTRILTPIMSTKTNLWGGQVESTLFTKSHFYRQTRKARKFYHTWLTGIAQVIGIPAFLGCHERNWSTQVNRVSYIIFNNLSFWIVSGYIQQQNY